MFYVFFKFFISRENSIFLKLFFEGFSILCVPTYRYSSSVRCEIVNFTLILGSCDILKIIIINIELKNINISGVFSLIPPCWY